MLLLKSSIFLFLVLVYSKGENVTNIVVKRINGISLEEITRPDAIYETSLPVVFLVTLPKVLPRNVSRKACEMRDINCVILQKQEDLSTEIFDFESHLATQNKSSSTRSGRKKRQLLGAAALAIGGIYALTHWGSGSSQDEISSLMATDEVIQAHVKSLELAEARRSKQMAIVKKDIEFLALHQQKFEGLVTDVLNSTQRQMRALFNLQLRMVDYIRFMDLINSCRLRLIPEVLINATTMTKALKRVRNRGNEHGISPTVSVDNVMALFSKPIVKCVFSQSLVLVTVQIPMRKKEDYIKLYRVTPVSFQYHGDICKIDANIDYAAILGKDIYAVSNVDCDLNKGLCRVNTGAPVLSSECIFTIIKRGSVEDLMSRCAYRCSRAVVNTPYVTRVGHLTYVANVKALNVTCPNKTYAYTSTGVGAYEVILSEHCFIETGENNNLILPVYPTINQEDLGKDHYLHIAVPAAWTSAKSAVSTDPALFTNITGLIDSQWTKKLKVFNMTSDDLQQTFPEWTDLSPRYLLNYATQKLEIFVLYTWAVFVTICVLLLLWKTYFSPNNNLHRNAPRFDPDMIPLRRRDNGR